MIKILTKGIGSYHATIVVVSFERPLHIYNSYNYM